MTAHSSPDINELSAHSAQEDLLCEPVEEGDNDNTYTPIEPPPSPAPSYPHTPIPAYTSQPHTTERTVTRGPPTAAELTASIEYTTAKRFRISFGGQPPGRTTTDGPEYARGSKVRGVVQVVDKWRDRIGSVELKVLGTIKLSIHDSGSTNTVFLSHSIRLHPAQPSTSASAPTSTCPAVLPFKWALPTTYVDTYGNPPTQRIRPLPPSYELTIPGVPGLRARVRYEVEVVVKWKWKGLVTRKESLSTPFTYIPYAPHPQHAHSSVLSTLKTCPGEWACYTERVPTRGPDVGEITSSVRPLLSLTNLHQSTTNFGPNPKARPAHPTSTPTLPAYPLPLPTQRRLSPTTVLLDSTNET
ncbi:hypothetical protein FRC12_024634 [Ceratobasidium sp. 428]|nr:hypothetical protein FRC12_024634 [Ceratobasidium sp. 428]